MRHLIWFLVVLPILAIETVGQTKPAGPPKLPPSPKAVGQPLGRPSSPLDISQEKILTARPEVDYDTLMRDRGAIDASLPAIKYIFRQTGLTVEDAEKATLSAWQQLRVQRLEPTATLSPKDLINQVSGLGKLVITSTPSGAVVELNGTKMDDQTEAVAWPASGTHRVRLSKPGYEIVEGTCEVKEGKTTEFHRDLPPEKH